MAAIPTICDRTGPHNLWLKDADRLRVGSISCVMESTAKLRPQSHPTRIYAASKRTQNKGTMQPLFQKLEISQVCWLSTLSGQGSLGKLDESMANTLHRIDAPLSENSRLRIPCILTQTHRKHS